jgi:hypothetical protein
MWLGAPEAAADAVPRTIAFLHKQFQALLLSDRNTEGDRE